MNEKFKNYFKFLLAAADVFSLLLSFTIAYILRVKLTDRPPAFHIGGFNFITQIAITIPIWVILISLLGLYNYRIYDHKAKEIPRLAFVSLIGTMMMISINFISDEPIFPSKLVAVYSLLLSFAILVFCRSLLQLGRELLLKFGYGAQAVLIVGDDSSTRYLINYLEKNPGLGYKIVGVIAKSKFIPKKFDKNRIFRTVKLAQQKTNPEIIFHTNMEKGDNLYDFAVNNHIQYSYVQSHQALTVAKHDIEIVGTLPLVTVRTTPLAGYGHVIKRLMDIVGSAIIILLSSPIWIFIIVLMKIFEPKAPIIFKQKRLSRFNKPVYIYKFRSMKQAYCGISPEEAFTKMGKESLIKKYRANGDQIENDPRVTKIGRILRKTSMDELPQLINVIKGDISLVGPRALVAEELEKHPQKNLILTVKSGLTGLAQVSGRRDISFEQRRKLDAYYVHNWSIWLDIQILFKTVWYVLFGKGAV